MIELRTWLTATGLDAGPVTIAWHLEQEGLKPPSPATISRILTRAGLVCPQPRKRPRSSYLRFEMAQPNEMWQSDFIHWRLADGSDVDVLNWLDDHSRYLLSATAHEPVTGETVVSVFLEIIEQYGPPASTLTDNGSVYTSRFTGGRNAFEYVLPLLGVQQKNGSPGHPQTQGKTERFHQTLQRWLTARPVAVTIRDLQRQLDQFREHYNEHRPHRALHRRTPGHAYRSTPKAAPAGARAQQHYRLRYDRLNSRGKMTLRRAGRMHQLGIGAIHARKRVLALAHDRHITVTELTTGELLSVHLIEPNKAYCRNQNNKPGRAGCRLAVARWRSITARRPASSGGLSFAVRRTTISWRSRSSGSNGFVLAVAVSQVLLIGELAASGGSRELLRVVAAGSRYHAILRRSNGSADLQDVMHVR